MLDTVLFWFSGARDKELREIPFNEIEIVLDYYENKIHIMGSIVNVWVKPYVKGKGKKKEKIYKVWEEVKKNVK